MIAWPKRHFYFLLSHRDFQLVPLWKAEKNPDIGLGKYAANFLLKIKKPVGWEHLILLFPRVKNREGKMLFFVCNAHRWRKAFVSPGGDIMRNWRQRGEVFVPTL